MGQSWPLFVLFLFSSCYNFNTNWKKHRWCAWDSNPGPQDGRRRQNHGAMAATSEQIFESNPDVIQICNPVYVFLILDVTGLFFFIFVFSLQLIENKICWGLDSKCRSLVSKVTILPTAPQPLPNRLVFWWVGCNLIGTMISSAK